MECFAWRNYYNTIEKNLKTRFGKSILLIHYPQYNPLTFHKNDCCCAHILPQKKHVYMFRRGSVCGKDLVPSCLCGLKEGTKRQMGLQCLQHKFILYWPQNGITKIILRKLLNARVRHTAVRFNENNAMVHHWWFVFVAIYKEHHAKYFIHAHHLLYAIRGVTSPHLAHVLRWNRKVNRSVGTQKSQWKWDVQFDIQSQVRHLETNWHTQQSSDIVECLH